MEPQLFQIVLITIGCLLTAILGLIGWLGLTVVSLASNVQRLTTIIEESLNKRLVACEERLHHSDKAFEQLRTRMTILEER